MTKILRYLCLYGCLCFLFPSAAIANEPGNIGTLIVEFFDPSNNPTQIEASSSFHNDKDVELIEQLIEAVFTSDASKLSNALLATDSQATPNDRQWQDSLAFAEGVQSYLKIEDRQERTIKLIEYFDVYDNEQNWYLKSVSYSLSGFLHMSKNQLLIGSERVANAMKLIPSELSPKVTAARILASDVSMVLNGLQGHPEFMLEAAYLLKDARNTQGEAINRHELMTNFVFALNRARDYQSAAMVAELLLLEPRPDDAVHGVAESYMAATFNELGQYDRAEALARTALENSAHPVVDQRGNLELVVALSGQGKTHDAVELMKQRDWKDNPDTLLDTTTNQSILHAEALMAMHRRDAGFALSLMKRRADVIIDQLQTANSSDIGAMLSNLENTRERQVERENALQREAEMRAVQLEQKNNLNRLLWVLIGGLTIAFNLLLAFLRYRVKLSAKVQGLQEDALSAEKMKTEFLGVINHELRTPLNGIIGISDAMIHHAPDAATKAQAETVQASGQLLHDLLDSLITMSTIEGNRLTLDEESASLAQTIAREAAEWSGAAKAKGLQFTQFTAPELQDPVTADHKRIRQTLRFLLSNAVRFTHQGRIHLHATGEVTESGEMALKIIVADTGQGMSEAVQDRLFKPFLQADAFMTRKYGGAGLSLAIGRKLARMMDGDLVVKSREGRGSEFIFTAQLPLSASLNNTQNQSDASLTPPLSPDLEALDQPEEIIDLMLEKQLPATKASASHRATVSTESQPPAHRRSA